MGEHWYGEAIIYSVDVKLFADSDDDGIGDLRGLIGRLDYLQRLGVSCLWLNPIHPTPGLDDGYDVSDYYGVNPQLGSLGDFAQLLRQAANLGIRIIIDLVVNHTSDRHPWFQQARADPRSPRRDWYVWSDHEPGNRYAGVELPGEQSETWSYDRKARAWFHHRFHRFQPDLNIANPRVRAEIKKIVGFWLQLGVAGFRVDAANFLIELVEPDNPDPPLDFDFLTELRAHLTLCRGDAVMLAEANVPPHELIGYVADIGGTANRIHMLFDFLLNDAMILALARRSAEPLVVALKRSPRLPSGAQWATFLRNHDEVDLSRLTAEQRHDVLADFAPEPGMRIFDRGIRRRLAPMLGGDRRRLEMAHSLQLSLRGTPVLRYGEEIGMGDLLKLPGRDAIRTPMQWSSAAEAGFTGGSVKPVRPLIATGPFGYGEVNVARQHNDPASLLAWFERMLRTLRECREVGAGICTAVDKPMGPGVFVHRCDDRHGSMLFVHNLSDRPERIDLSELDAETEGPYQMFGNDGYPDRLDLGAVEVDGYGYRWIRLRRDRVA